MEKRKENPDVLGAHYNLSSPSVKRILKEIKEMQRTPSSLFTATPLDDNIFEWHFTMRGPRGTDFEGGVYHGKILLPEDYPFKPPDMIFLTQNGRFEVGKKICLTISSHHAETWQPSWSVRTVVLALISFMPTRGDGAIASLDWPTSERQKLARQSLSYKCPVCGVYNLTALPPEDEKEDLPAPPPELVIKNKEQQERDEAAKKASTSSSPSTPSSQSSPSSPSAEPAASSPSASPPPSESDSSLRQRLPPVEEAPLPPHVPHEAEALAPRELDAAELAAALPQPRVQVQGGGLRQWLDVLIAFIIVAIIALLFRRIFLPNLRLDYYFQ